MRQAQLRRFLRGCEEASLGDREAHDVGALAGKAKSIDVVDVHVVVVADRLGVGVVTSDERGLKPIVAALGRRVPVRGLTSRRGAIVGR